MKAILSKSVPNLGEAGDLVDVSPGYFRNFLVPRNLATEATAQHIAEAAQHQKAKQRVAEREKIQAQALADKLGKVVVRVALKAGENDRLFGSVTAADVADKLHRAGYEFDRRKIVLDEPIKRLGMYTVHIRVHPEVDARINVLVEKA